MSTTIRRSRRRRTVNPKYTRNDWDEQALRLIQDSDSESDDGGEKSSPLVVSDDDFVEPQQALEPETGEHNGMASGNSSNHGSDQNVSESEASLGNDEPPDPMRPTKKRKVNVQRKAVIEHSRGLPTIDRKTGKTLVFQDTFGTSEKDVLEILAAHDRWHVRARDAGLPSRSTLQDALRKEWSAQSMPQNNVERVRHLSLSRQRLGATSMAALQSEGALSGSKTRCVVLGRTGNEHLYEVEYLNSLDFGKGWEEKDIPHDRIQVQQQGRTDTQSSSAVDGRPQIRSHEGWLLNVGEKINALAWWSDCGRDAEQQYLAVVCRSTQSQRSRTAATDSNRSHAFSPSPAYVSNIQIWSIACRKLGSEGMRMIDFNHRAKLSHSIATHIGDIMQIAWLPISDHDTGPGEHLGSLAILSTDGSFRVVDVPISLSDPALVLTVNMEEPAICIKPQQGTIFSTFTFAGPTDVIIGSSNGEVSLFNLDEHRHSASVAPYMVVKLHHTYVMGLSTAGHGELSHFLASTSAAGDMRLTDLRAPYQDFIVVPKSRLPTRNLSYCPTTQSFITTVDHSGRTEVQAARTTIAAHQLRHFYSQVLLSKFPNNTGTASALATSLLHPYILVGNTQGTVQCQNIFKKLLPRGGGWVQKLCEYEWILEDQDASSQLRKGEDIPDSATTEANGISSNTTSVTASSLYYGNDVRPGLSRFREGYILEKQDLVSSTTRAGKHKTKTKPIRKKPSSDDQIAFVDDGDDEIPNVSRPGEATGEAVAEVIFEEENAVTAMCWNPNPTCAAWVAIGWGSGLIRIQDLSHDTR